MVVDSSVGVVHKDGAHRDDDDGEATEMQPLAAPDETPVKFERSLVVNGTETVVVDNEDQLPTSTVPAVRFCLLGSDAHRRALLEKRKQTEEAIALAEQARLAREAEEARLTEEAERLDRQIHALDERRETHEEALKENIKSAEDGEAHSTAHRFGTLKHFVNLDYHPEERLIRKPIVRQFFRSETTPDGTQRDVLYREAEHRSATWNELFFDLVMVAVLHSLGHTFAQNFSGAALERFLLTFAPIWLVWTDMTYFLNIHDNGDLIIKIFVYVQMVFVVGMGASATYALETTTNQYVGAFLLARVVMMLMAIYYSYRIPDFRAPILRTPMVAAFCSIPFLALFALSGQALINAWWAANVIVLVLGYLIGILMMPLMRKRYNLRVALNIEHYSERFGLLTIIALGENITSVVFSNVTTVMQSTYALAALGLLSTYSLQWIYFDVDASRNFQHALRRNVITGFLFSITHLPMQIAIVAAGASLGYIVEINGEYVTAVEEAEAGNTGSGIPTPEEVFPESQRWLYCVSVATALWFMALLGTLHKSLDQVTVTPLDTFGKKVVNFISGYGFIASRKKSVQAAGDDHNSDDVTSVHTADSSGSRTDSSVSDVSGVSGTPSASSTSSGAPLQRRKTAMSEFIGKMRTKHAQYKANRLAVTNVRKNTRILLRVLVGLAIALLPLAGEHFSPVGLVGTVAGILTALVIFEMWGGLRVNTITDVGHHRASSGIAMMLVAAAALAPAAFLSAHGHDVHSEHMPHIAHRHDHTGKGSKSGRGSSYGTVRSLFASTASNSSWSSAAAVDVPADSDAPAAAPVASSSSAAATDDDATRSAPPDVPSGVDLVVGPGTD